MTSNPLEQVTTYVLEFLLGSEPRTVLVQAIDAPNGVVLEETADGSGMMRGLLLGGGKIEIPFPRILKIEKRYEVTTHNGQVTRVEKMSERRVERLIDNCTNKETGEISGFIREIKDTKDPENKVTRREKEL